MEDWIIVGCGYTGSRLARLLLKRGHNVYATRRSEDALAALRLQNPSLKTISTDVSDLVSSSAPWKGATVVFSAPPHKEGPEIEEDFANLMSREGIRRLIYISSTGVYPALNGEWIEEGRDLGPPTSAHGQRRLLAENAIFGPAIDSRVSLRAAGIYGPGRGIHVRMQTGSYKLLGEGNTYVNRIHVDDLSKAVLLAGQVKELIRPYYNVADGNPKKTREQAIEVAELLNLPMPESMPLSEASPMARAFLMGNRRISNRILREELGWAPSYPTLAEGIAQAMAEESSA